MRTPADDEIVVGLEWEVWRMAWGSFKYDVTGEELAKLIDHRVVFYEEQAKAYQAKRDDIAERNADNPSRLAQLPTWDTLIRHAKNRADFLRFQRDSLVRDTTYRVDDFMLDRLDLTLEFLRKQEASATW